MKKLVSLLLALALVTCCMFALASCTNNAGKGKDNGKGDGFGDPSDIVGDTEGQAAIIYGLVAASNPTKVVSQVYFTTANGEDLDSHYITSIEGNDSITEYRVTDYATQEDIEDGITDRIIEREGFVYFKDGLYSTDGKSWSASAPAAVEIIFNFKEEFLTNPTISENGTKLTCSATKENAVNIFGSDFKSAGDISIVVTTDGVNLYMIELEYVTVEGASVTIRTSYTYEPISLVFPSAEGNA